MSDVRGETIRFGDGTQKERTILVQGGRAIHFASIAPGAWKPELALQLGHPFWAKVTSVAFSPDGRQILTGSWDTTARLWGATTGQELRRFVGHTSGVTSVAFSRHGRQVLTGSLDNTARLWDAATGRELRRFVGHTRFLMAVAFSREGRQVLTGSADDTARLWDAATGRELARFEGHADGVLSGVFSPDSRQVLTGSFDETARLWDAATGQELRRFEGHTSCVTSAAFSPDGRQVLTARSIDDTARLWDAATAKEIRRFEGHRLAVSSVAFSPDGEQVLTGSWDRTARLWDAATGEELRRFVGLSGVGAFSPDGRQVLTGSDDGTARLWDISSGDQLAALISLHGSEGWLVVTPEGLFNGSRTGCESVHFRTWIDRKPVIVPVDRFFQDFYHPGLLAEIWQGKRPMPGKRLGSTPAASAEGANAFEHPMTADMGILTFTLLAGLGAVEDKDTLLGGDRVNGNTHNSEVDVLDWFRFAEQHMPRLAEKLAGQKDYRVETRGREPSFALLRSDSGQPTFRTS